MAEPDSAPPPALRCLLGGHPPPAMGSDLESLLDLPEAARAEFWQVLAAYLKPDLDDEARSTIVGYCTRHDLPSSRIAPAIKAARFLFQAGARAHLQPKELAEDLRALAPASAPTLEALLIPWFDDFAPKLRRQSARESIADHGKLVVGTSWRIDRIVRSKRGREMDTSVALMTFRYLEGDREGRVTLQLLPETIAELREAADEMLGTRT